MNLPLLRRTRTQTGAETERRAFEILIEQSWDALWRFAYRMAGNRDDAEDLLSESLVGGFQSFHQFRGHASFTSWMYRIMTTTRIDMLRKSRRHQMPSLDQPSEDSGTRGAREIPDQRADPAKTIVEPMLSEAVQEALNALPEEFRAVVVLADIEEHDYQEISRILGIPVGTVRSRLHRGRAQVRKALGPSLERGGH